MASADRYFGFDLLQRRTLQELLNAETDMSGYLGFNTTQINTLRSLLEGSGGGLPAGADALGIGPLTMPEVEDGFGSVPLPTVTVYLVVDGVFSVNPPEAVITWSAIPAGTVTGFDGAVSIEDNTTLVGTTVGTALVGLNVAVGAPGADGNQSLQMYLPVTVVPAP